MQHCSLRSCVHHESLLAVSRPLPRRRRCGSVLRPSPPLGLGGQVRSPKRYGLSVDTNQAGPQPVTAKRLPVPVISSRPDWQRYVRSCHQNPDTRCAAQEASGFWVQSCVRPGAGRSGNAAGDAPRRLRQPACRPRHCTAEERPDQPYHQYQPLHIPMPATHGGLGMPPPASCKVYPARSGEGAALGRINSAGSHSSGPKSGQRASQGEVERLERR